jgi:hypothetical protein
MKKTTFVPALLVIAMFSLTFSSCMNCIHGKGEVKTHSIPLMKFTGIKLNTEADVFLVSDSVKNIVVEAQDNIADNLELKVRDGLLIVKNRKCINTNEPVKIFIPARLVEDLQINGSGNIMSKIPLEAKTLALKINGSGNLRIGITAETIFSEINGSGSIYLNGSAKKHKTLINGSGNLEAFDMPTEGTEITVNGSGSCQVFAISKLEVLLRGSGDVVYKGSPDVSTTIKGSGSVNKSGN